MLNKFATLGAGILMLIGSAAWAGPVDINSADAETLAAELNGVGTEKAAAIVAYREANGPFQSADELSAVTGIGEKTVEKNRDNIIVSSKKK